MARTPRPRPGAAIRAEHIIALADAIDRAQVNVGPGSGLGMSVGPGGTDLWSSASGKVHAKFKLTTTATAAVGLAYTTTGRGTLLFDAGAGTLAATPTTGVVLRNDHTKSFVAGSTIIVTCIWIMSAWFIVDVSDCAAYV